VGVAFFVDNRNLGDLDFSCPLTGNPGCGASEYMPFLLGSALAERKVNVQFLLTKPVKIPKGTSFTLVRDFEESVKVSLTNNLLLVTRIFQRESSTVLSVLKNSPESRVVFWCHLSPDSKQMRSLAALSSVKAIVCLEDHQLLRFFDGPSNFKSVKISYGIDSQCSNPNSLHTSELEKLVVYLGALTPQKGFHVLAEIWPNVVKRCPQARLEVIGSATLYNANHKSLGKYGLTGADYEQTIIDLLGKSISSVKFHGTLDAKSRSSVLSRARVGIVNPTGNSETFCLAGVEMQMHSIPVIGGRRNGLLDTIRHGETGYLVRRKHQLENKIVKILNNDNIHTELAMRAQKFTADTYALNRQTELWLKLIQQIEENSLDVTSFPNSIRKKYPFRYFPTVLNQKAISLMHFRLPTIEEYIEVAFKILRKLKI
jgi:glycosyltransferase involved in cell wall biosynthesis